MFKIGDFSKFSRVSVKTLRYYDEIGLLKPVKVDPYSDYRYYSADQLTRLNYILALKEMGLTLDEISGMLDSSLTSLQLKDIFVLKRGEIRQRLDAEQKRLHLLEKLLVQIEKEGTMPEYAVTIKKVEPQLVASIRNVMPDYASIGPVYGDIFKYLAKKMIFKPFGPVMFICHDNEYKESDVDIEAVVPINKKIADSDKVKIYELPGVEKAASTVYKGAYSGINEAYTALMRWVENNGYQIDGPYRELYFTDPTKVKDPSENVTELQFPIKKI